jgi:hypothetical protein
MAPKNKKAQINTYSIDQITYNSIIRILDEAEQVDVMYVDPREQAAHLKGLFSALRRRIEEDVRSDGGE